MHTTKDSKNSLFFIVVPLGFEDVAQTEIHNHLSVLYPEFGPCKQGKGGIELELPLEIGLALNHLLRIPTRILLRLEKFRCRDFPKLYKKAQNYPWSPFLLGKMPKIHVTAKKSRMIHTGRIEESITKGLQDYFKGYPPSKALQAQGDSTLSPPDLYVDFYDDNCQWSLNVSGEPLYFRSIKVQRHVMEAPIRENLATALLALLLQQYKQAEKPILIDPMGGSGVFLSEAWAMGTPIDRPFAYQFFKKHLALHLLAMMRSVCLSTVSVEVSTAARRVEGQEARQQITGLAKEFFFLRYIYRDKDTKALEAARHNLAPLIEHQLLDSTSEDLFQASEIPRIKSTAPILLIVNPPYGVRLNLGPITLLQLFLVLTERYAPTLMGIIIPKEWSVGPDWSKVSKMAKQKSYRVVLTRPFQNGGLDVLFVVWQRSSTLPTQAPLT